jgi:WD40 repeat protein
VLPDGRLASGSHDNSIRLWDPTTGAEAARLERHSGLVAALCVLPDRRHASGSYDSTIRLWDPTAGAEAARLEGHSGPVAALCVLPDGRLSLQPDVTSRSTVADRPRSRRMRSSSRRCQNWWPTWTGPASRW